MVRLWYLLIFLAAISLSGCGDEKTTVSACVAPGVLLSDVSLSVEGIGFFTLSTGTELQYSRKGDFCVDQNGFLINGLGNRVQGFPPTPGDGGFNAGSIEDLVLPPDGPFGGVLTDVMVSSSGVLEAVYTGGSNVVFAELALATFPSSQNLRAEAGGICRVTMASGPASRGEPGRAEFGTIQPGLQGPFACEQGRLNARVIGEGHFRLSNAGTIHYATSMILGVDSLGNYVDDHGYRVSGYTADANGTIVPALVDLTRAAAETMDPVATSRIDLGANLDAGAGPPVVSPFDVNDPLSYNVNADVTVFDSFGLAHTATFYFVKRAVASTWDLYLYLDGALMLAGGSAFQALTFSAGVLTSVGSIVYDPVIQLSGAWDLTITLVTTGLTQTSAAFAVTSRVQNGYAPGRVSATQVSANGEIRLDYSNGRSGVLLAQLVLAKFPNPGALVLSADGETHLETAGAGAPVLDLPGESGLGDVTATAR